MASKSRRNKVKFKWTKELIFLIVFVVAIGAVSLTLGLVKKFSGRDIKAVNEAIAQFNSSESQTVYTIDTYKNVFKPISYNGLVSQKASSDYKYVWYGTLTSADYLRYLYQINEYAEQYEVSTVYLYYADYVQDAINNDTHNTESYKTTLKTMEDKLNAGRTEAEPIDLEKYAALFVFKDGKLVYNSQIANESDQYNWENQFVKAFSLSKQGD
jgi:hypothetical protein